MSQLLRIAAVFVLCLGGVAFSRGWVRDQAAKENIAEIPWLQEMDPIDFIGTTALGGLRPLFIDLLWVRAADAFSRKDWFDALPIAELICRLQPNLPSVWETNSWNMAYNISAAKKQADKLDEAFQWILKGMDFQRKGISKNPGSSTAHAWLANMAFDKGRSDEYAPMFEERGIDTLGIAIEEARKANQLEKRDHWTPYALALYLRKKIEKVERAEGEKAALINVPLAAEAIEALKLSRGRCPENKDFKDFIELIDQRISALEKVLESAKVQGGSESKKSGGK